MVDLSRIESEPRPEGTLRLNETQYLISTPAYAFYLQLQRKSGQRWERGSSTNSVCPLSDRFVPGSLNLQPHAFSLERFQVIWN